MTPEVKGWPEVYLSRFTGDEDLPPGQPDLFVSRSYLPGGGCKLHGGREVETYLPESRVREVVEELERRAVEREREYGEEKPEGAIGRARLAGEIAELKYAASLLRALLPTEEER